MTVNADVAAAYSATGSAWQTGPGRIYDHLAEILVGRSPAPLHGCRALDVGAGTGAATRALQAAGAAEVVAVDAATGMLTYGAAERVPAVTCDALALPFDAAAFDASVAAFALNHLADPDVGLREMVRVTRPDGVLIASSYAEDDTHPVKPAVEAALEARGWEPEPWYDAIRTGAAPRMATVDACAAVAAAAGIEAEIEAIRVRFPELTPEQLVAWRLGMAQHAPFFARFEAGDRAAITAEAVTRLGPDPPVLERSIVVLRAVMPRGRRPDSRRRP